MPFSAREATFGEPCTVPDESSLALFSLLRSLCEFLPQEHYDRFMSSRTRLLLDYVISRLSGNAGLLQRASAHREALPPAEKEAAAAIVPDFGRIVSEKEEASEEEGIQLVTHVVDDLFSLIAAVPDANLRTAMDNATKELVEKLIQQ